MKYQMRRKDREESGETALRIIDRAPFAVMATADPDGHPYCTPLSFVRDGEALYFHCALSGHKIDNLKRDPRVCVSFTGEIFFPEDDFTVAYESATVMGVAEEVTGDDEKIRGLRLLCERFTPKNMPAFDVAIAKSLAATGVWKIRIGEVSAKRRKHPRQHPQN
jgi:nitroimidazol reductase NimA-like FMN-containing flavoprotein (pyridoxamine 5'-phosphate oxidase superfamily)